MYLVFLFVGLLRIRTELGWIFLANYRFGILFPNRESCIDVLVLPELKCVALHGHLLRGHLNECSLTFFVFRMSLAFDFLSGKLSLTYDLYPDLTRINNFASFEMNVISFSVCCDSA